MSRLLATLATGGLAAGTVLAIARNQQPLKLDSGAPTKIFGGGPAFLSLPLESAEMASHDTKRLRFKLPSSGAVSDLPLTSSLLTMSWPKGSWTPVARPYTPITPSDEPGHIDLLVKRYPSGKQSTHIHSLAPGETLLFALPIKGPQWQSSSSGGPASRHLTLIAGGAGITPIFQLAQGILRDASDTSTSMTVVLGANSDRDVLLRRELEEFEGAFPGRFKAIYTVSRPEPGSPFRAGYVTRELLDQAVPASDRGKVYLCGPPGMESALVGKRGSPGILEQLGYPKEHIYRF